MKLEVLGLRPGVTEAFDASYGKDHLLARVSCVERGFVRVLSEEGEGTYHVPKSVYRAPDAIERIPVTGDWVAIHRHKAAVESVLPRWSSFRRRAAGRRDEAQVVAANADLVFVLMGLDGDFNIRRLERYLTLCSESGARAVVLLTKAGLCVGVASRVVEVEAIARGVSVHAIDVVSNIQDDAPLHYLTTGVTAALIGSSGVGKSTLANFLMREQVARTQQVREHDERGKHTTSRRELFVLDRGGIIIDTPGMRELALWGESGSVDAAFPDVVELAADCRFSDCRHVNEPDCAVRSAIESGVIDASRVESYRSLARELEAKERRTESKRPASSRKPPRSYK